MIRLVETNVIMRRRFRGVKTTCPGTGKTRHTAREIHPGSARHAASTAEFRSHLIDKGHYLGIVLVFEDIRRIRRDLLESLGYFRILYMRMITSSASSRKIYKNYCYLRLLPKILTFEIKINYLNLLNIILFLKF